MKCNDDSCDAVHCPVCGGHKLGWYTTGVCEDCEMSAATQHITDEMILAVQSEAQKNYEKTYGWQVLVECMEKNEIVEMLARSKATTVAEAIKAAEEFQRLHTDRYEDARAEVF